MKKLSIILAIFLVSLMSVVVSAQSCGDLVCDVGEDGLNCPSDCEVSLPFTMGDGTSLSYTDPVSGVTYTLETNNPGPKTLTGVADATTKATLQVDMTFEKASTSSTTATIRGLSPNIQYHLYTDSYRNHQVITADASGSYSFTQDTSTMHYVWIQAEPSTKFLRDDPTGGDCSSVGTYNVLTKTCILTANSFESYEIESDDYTLDCNGQSITGTGLGIGVFISGRTGVTVKNCVISGFSVGINSFSGAGEHTFTGNTMSDTFSGMTVLSSSFNTMINNDVIGRAGIGLGIQWSGGINNTIAGNNVSNTLFGLIGSLTRDDIISNNEMSLNTFAMFLGSANSETITGNNVHDNNLGVRLSSASSGNTITGNTMNDNSQGLGLTFNANNNIVSGNTLRRNDIAIVDIRSKFNTYSVNTISDSIGAGIRILNSDDANVSGNTFTDDILSIRVDESRGTKVTKNTIQMKSGSISAISLDRSDNTEITLNKATMSGPLLFPVLEGVYANHDRGRGFSNIWASNDVTVDSMDTQVYLTDTETNNPFYGTAHLSTVNSELVGTTWRYTGLASGSVVSMNVDEVGNDYGGFTEMSIGQVVEAEYIMERLSPLEVVGYSVNTFGSPLNYFMGTGTVARPRPDLLRFGMTPSRMLDRERYDYSGAHEGKVSWRGDVLSTGSFFWRMDRLSYEGRAFFLDLTNAFGRSLNLRMESFSTVVLDTMSMKGPVGSEEYTMVNSLTTTGSVEVSDRGIPAIIAPGANFVAREKDTDGDGYSDGVEGRFGSDPNDPSDPVQVHAHKDKVLIDLGASPPISRLLDHPGFEVKAVDPNCAATQPDNKAAFFNCPGVPVISRPGQLFQSGFVTSSVFFVKKGTYKFIVADTFFQDFPPGDLPITGFDGKTVTLTAGLNDINFGKPFMNVVLADGVRLAGAGDRKVIRGSELIVEYGAQLYFDVNTGKFLTPFIFSSQESWTVDVCASVPPGFDIVNADCQQTFVMGDNKLVMFEFVETGSPPPELTANIQARGPSGKVQSLTLNVKGIGIAKEGIANEKAKGKPFVTGSVVAEPKADYRTPAPNVQEQSLWSYLVSSTLSWLFEFGVALLLLVALAGTLFYEGKKR